MDRERRWRWLALGLGVLALLVALVGFNAMRRSMMFGRSVMVTQSAEARGGGRVERWVELRGGHHGFAHRGEPFAGGFSRGGGSPFGIVRWLVQQAWLAALVVIAVLLLRRRDAMVAANTAPASTTVPRAGPTSGDDRPYTDDTRNL